MAYTYGKGVQREVNMKCSSPRNVQSGQKAINQDHISKSVSPFGTFSFIQHLQSEESENYKTI